MQDGETLSTKEHTEAHGDKIGGYRKLSDNEIADINAIKSMGNDIGAHLDTLEGREGIDKRWLAIARTDLQKGVMAAVRAIAKPEGF